MTPGERAAERAMAQLSQELDEGLRRAVEAAARRAPTAEVCAISAMGDWFLHVTHPKGRHTYRYGENWTLNADGTRTHNQTPPIFARFAAMQDRYGWAAIPAPVRYDYKNGAVTRSTDW